MTPRTETHETGSVEETLAVAARLASTLRAGDVVYLEGELGTGKTHFVKGLAVGLGIDPDDIRSPTFTFVDVHAPASAGRIGLVHVDLYRIADVADLAELGLEDLPGEGAVLALEWPDRLVRRSLRAVLVRIADLGGTRRRIEVVRPA